VIQAGSLGFLTNAKAEQMILAANGPDLATVHLWELVDRIQAAAQMPPVNRTVSLRFALPTGSLLEEGRLEAARIFASSPDLRASSKARTF
jgi:hypothetical protein